MSLFKTVALEMCFIDVLLHFFVFKSYTHIFLLILRTQAVLVRMDTQHSSMSVYFQTPFKHRQMLNRTSCLFQEKLVLHFLW